jgi:hypothetical protein
MRWTALAMFAHAFLSVMTAAQPAPELGGTMTRPGIT